jgi:hypothetical protein
MSSTEVKTADGLTRYSVKCRLCDARWIEEADKSLSLGYQHDCPGMAAWKAECLALLAAGERAGYPVWRLDYKAVSWKYRGDAKACDNRCKGARGHKCDCPCLGLNHGLNHTVKLGDR